MSEEEQDVRKKDASKLGEHGIEGAWKLVWENTISNSTDKLIDTNQKLWRVSRLSFLEGYLTARGKSMTEIFLATVLEDNRITIPKDTADVVKIKKGSKVRITIERVRA